MTLLSFLKNIILEIREKRAFISKFNYNDGEVLLFASYHQNEERFGNKSFEEILDMYYTYGLKMRIGVPNDMIKNFFEKNFEKIYQEFNVLESNNINKNKRLHIIKNNKKQNEIDDIPKYFDFIEFIIQKNSHYDFEIITSAFSKDGGYLKQFDKTKNITPKLTAENRFHFDSTLII